jgi:hypothetical protein
MRELVPISRETPGSVIESDVYDEEKRETVSTVVRKEVDFRHKDFEIMDNAHSVVSTIYMYTYIYKIGVSGDSSQDLMQKPVGLDKVHSSLSSVTTDERDRSVPCELGRRDIGVCALVFLLPLDTVSTIYIVDKGAPSETREDTIKANLNKDEMIPPGKVERSFKTRTMILLVIRYP